MAGHCTGVDESRQSELFEHGGSHIIKELLPDHIFDKLAGQGDPTESECGREGFARTSRVSDPLRGKSLKGTNGCLVVPKLGIVVVLDDQRVVVLRPFDECRSPRWAENSSARIGVRRRD